MQLPSFLTKDPDGTIRLTGHRIGIASVIFRAREGMSAKQIAEHYPTLSLEQVRGVLDFRERNQLEVDAYVDFVAAEMKRLERESPYPRLTIEELERRYKEKFANPA